MQNFNQSKKVQLHLRPYPALAFSKRLLAASFLMRNIKDGSNTIIVAHAEALLKAIPPEQCTDVKPAEREKKDAPI